MHDVYRLVRNAWRETSGSWSGASSEDSMLPSSEVKWIREYALIGFLGAKLMHKMGFKPLSRTKDEYFFRRLKPLPVRKIKRAEGSHTKTNLDSGPTLRLPPRHYKPLAKGQEPRVKGQGSVMYTLVPTGGTDCRARSDATSIRRDFHILFGFCRGFC